MSTWKLTDREFESVLALDANSRYTHFVKRVADWRVVWGLATEQGWVGAADDDGKEYLPFWPHERYAAACADGAWSGSEPQAIELDEFLESWLTGMERDNLLVAVFPTPSAKGIPVAPVKLQSDLRAELEIYEDEL